jgi:hypothetical protein
MLLPPGEAVAADPPTPITETAVTTMQLTALITTRGSVLQGRRSNVASIDGVECDGRDRGAASGTRLGVIDAPLH